MSSSEQFRSAKELADVLGVTGKTVRRWIEAGKIHAFRHGRIWHIPESEFNRLIGKGEIHMEEFDYKKALRWLMVRDEEIANSIQYKCKKCGCAWSPMQPSGSSGHLDGRIMLTMLCPENKCNFPKGYEEAHERFKEEWQEETEDEREVYIKDGLEEAFDGLDEEDIDKEDIKEKREELIDDWTDSNKLEHERFIEDRFAEWMEEQYAARFVSSS